MSITMHYEHAESKVTPRKMSDLDQDVELSSSPLVQRADVVSDQGAEVMAEVQDVVQTVEHLRTAQETGAAINVNVNTCSQH